MGNLLAGSTRESQETELILHAPRVTTSDLDQRLRLLETLLAEISGVVKRVDSRLASIEASRELLVAEESTVVPRPSTVVPRP